VEKERVERDRELSERQEKSEELMRRAEALKRTADSETAAIRNKLESQQVLLDRLDDVEKENGELRMRVKRVEAEYEAFIDGEKDLASVNERLEREVEEMKGEVRRNKELLLKDRQQCEESVALSRSEWIEEKRSLENRVTELNKQLASLANKLTTTVSLYKQKKRRMKSLVTKLRERLNHLQITIDQLHVEKEAIRMMSGGAEGSEELKKRLRDLVQRNREFRSLLQASSIKQTDIAGLQFSSISPSEGLAFNPAINAFFDMNQKDLILLRDRIDYLDSTQKHQLDELKPNSAKLFHNTSLSAPSTHLSDDANRRPAARHDDVTTSDVTRGQDKAMSHCSDNNDTRDTRDTCDTTKRSVMFTD